MKTLPDKPLSVLIKEKAAALGFDLCGIAPSRPLEERERILADWCASGFNGGMKYLSENTGKRADPGKLFPGARSLVVTGLNYFAANGQTEPGVPVISRYAYGVDYHDVIIKKLTSLLEYVKTVQPSAAGKPYADTGPLLEKGWAVEAGLGWQGRHSIIINRKIGSFFFLGVLILDIPLDYDEPETKDNCGSCRLCIDACPTGAINGNRTIDARRCIANLTIENRDHVPHELVPLMGKRIYGCDRCQEVCPWNSKTPIHNVPEFRIGEELAHLTPGEWQNMTRERYKKLFRNTPLARKKYETFMENVRLLTGPAI